MCILEAHNIKYSYDGNKAVLRNVSIGFEVGKIYAILGPSGCGKTTLLSLLGGLDSPSDGKVLFQGEDIDKKGLAWHRKSNVDIQASADADFRALRAYKGRIKAKCA